MSRTAPTQSQASAAQLEAGNYRKMKRWFQGLPISIENRKGSTRSGTDRNGHEWSITMKWDYGYIRGSLGHDGDHVDCYIGPDPDAEYAYVITQNAPPTFTQVDEQKVMLGFDSEHDAKRAYLAHYDNPRFFREIKAMPMSEFKRKVRATRKSRSKLIKGEPIILMARKTPELAKALRMVRCAR